MSSAERASPLRAAPPLTAALTQVRDSARSDWDSAWVDLSPTFTDPKAVKLWERLSADTAGEERFFSHKHLLRTEKALAKELHGKYRQAQAEKQSWCLFDQCTRAAGQSASQVPAFDLGFRCQDDDHPDHTLQLRVGLLPAAWSYDIQRVPLTWLYDRRFVRFLQELVWDIPLGLGLLPTLAGGGGPFALSAKTYLVGSLCATTSRISLTTRSSRAGR